MADYLGERKSRVYTGSSIPAHAHMKRPGL